MDLKKLRQSITWRFTLVIFTISLILTVLSTLIHLTYTHRSRVQALAQEGRKIGQSSLPGLASSLWARDHRLVQTQLDGIVRIPHLECAQIVLKNHAIAVSGTLPKYPGPCQTFPIYYQHHNRPRYLGSLSIHTGLANIFEQIFWDHLFIYLISGAQIFLTALCILFIFRTMVGRPLNTITEYLNHFDIKHLAPPLHLPVGKADNPFPNEIEQIAMSIIILSDNIQKSFLELGGELTKRREIEEALRRSEERYRLLYENAGEGIYTFDRNLFLTGLNRKALELFGLPEEEMVGRNILDLGFLQNEDYDKATRDVGRLIAGEDVVHNEMRFIKRDGSVLDAEITRAALYDAMGQFFAVINIIRDITERKKNESQLLLMASVIEQTDLNIVITDSNGIIQYSNAIFEQTGGYQCKEIQGRHLSALFQDLKDEKIPSIRETISQGSGWNGRIKGKRKNGSLYEINLVITPIRGPRGVITNFVSFSRDVTHEMEMERYFRQVQKREALGTLAGGIAHEFNNILGAIIGYTEVELYELPEDNRTRHNLKKILTSSLRARDLIKQILAFIRQSGQERKVISIHDCLQEPLLILQAALPSTIELHYEQKTDQDFIRADPAEIFQVILNLCNNAAWAMKEKPGSLEIILEDASPTAENDPQLRNLSVGPYLFLTIRDTGRGINPEIMDRIFDPFYTTKEVGEGIGMGLAVVQGIVESLGGAIKVKSTPGKGTSFQIILPKATPRGPTPNGPGSPVRRGKGRILLVDDEDLLIEADRQMLENLGYEVIAQTNGLEALKVFKARPDHFDLVITDQTMPRMTGMDLALQIQAIRPDIPIILCTGFSEGITAQKVEAAGIKALVIKPLILDEISRLIHSLLPLPNP